MQIAMIYFMGFVNMFAKFGRYADLILGLVVLSLGLWWSSPLTMALGAFSIFAYAIDMNGRFQRASMAYARGRIARRGR